MRDERHERTRRKLASFTKRALVEYIMRECFSPLEDVVERLERYEYETKSRQLLDKMKAITDELDALRRKREAGELVDGEHLAKAIPLHSKWDRVHKKFEKLEASRGRR